MSPSFSSMQVLLLGVALAGLIRHLAKNADSISERGFVALSVVGGLLAVVLFGAVFRTMMVAGLLGLPLGGIDEHRLSWVKASIALSAAGLSVYESTLLAKNRAIRRCWSKGIAFAIAIISIGAYFRYGDVGHARFYHQHELFHYYLGSKYHRELGYERLYRCVAVAQADSGQANEVRVRKMMDLSIDRLVPAETALEHPGECRDRFTAERWDSFKADVGLFRSSVRLEYWNRIFVDHGYNPPPVWTMMGHFWSSLHPPTPDYLEFLAFFDLALYAAMFAAIGWAFGWRVFSVAAIFWGCQLPGDFYWTGGAFLRQDWLFLLVLSACLLQKRYYVLAGATLAYSTLLRIFPGIFLVGWATVATIYFLRHKRLASSHLKVMVGGAVATVALVTLSVGVAGVSSYPEFYKHILVHKHTPLTNNMGLETLLSQSYSGREQFVASDKFQDPFGRWKELRRERLRAFRPFQLVLLVALGIAFVKVVRRVRSLWVAQALSLAIVISVVELTCYYYSMFILAAFLSRLRKGVEQWVLCVAGMSQLLAVNRYLSNFDDRYTAESILFCFFAASLVFAHWPRGTKPAKLIPG